MLLELELSDFCKMGHPIYGIHSMIFSRTKQQLQLTRNARNLKSSQWASRSRVHFGGKKLKLEKKNSRIYLRPNS